MDKNVLKQLTSLFVFRMKGHYEQNFIKRLILMLRKKVKKSFKETFIKIDSNIIITLYT